MRQFYTRLRSHVHIQKVINATILHSFTVSHINIQSNLHFVIINLKLGIPFSDKDEHICLIKRVTRLLIIPSTSSRFLPIDKRFFNVTSGKTYKLIFSVGYMCNSYDDDPYNETIKIKAKHSIAQEVKFDVSRL